MGDEKPAKEENRYNEFIKDEASDLLSLYALENPTREEIRTTLEQHFEKFGRIGFNSSVDEETIERFYEHFTKNSPNYLEAELHFMQEILASDLVDILGQGYSRARELVPPQEYQVPQVIFLLNGRRTDAKVLDNGQFGINLQNLFRRVYSEEDNTYSMQRAQRIILNNTAHEITHILMEQIQYSGEDYDADPLIIGAFNEGLATFAQTELDYAWSMDFLQDSENTLKIIREVAEGAPYRTVITDLCNMESLKVHRPDEVLQAKALLSREDTSDEELQPIARSLLVEKNGPLYYAGYAVWRKIYEAGGIEKVREVVKKGPKAFAEFM